MNSLLLFAAASLLLYCQNNKDTGAENASKTKVASLSQGNENIPSPASDTGGKPAAAGKWRPLTNKEMASLLPDAVGTFKLEFSHLKEAGENADQVPTKGAEMGSYSAAGGTDINVHINDCVRMNGGPCDLSKIKNKSLGVIEQESQGTHEAKFIELMGGPALLVQSTGKGEKPEDEEESDDHVLSLMYVMEKRFMVSLTCNKNDLPTVMEFAKNLKLKL